MPKSKTGAGYLFVSGGFCLLTKRVSSHNDKTWDLSGGNVDGTDEDLAVTALREAEEELGHVPKPFKVTTSLTLRRGKHGQKQYTVFVAEVPVHVREEYVPELDLSEHSDWHWFQLEGLVQLHDYYQKNGIPNVTEDDDEAGSGGKKGAQGNKKHHKHDKGHDDDDKKRGGGKEEDGNAYIREGIVLHPWVYLLFEQQTRARWLPSVIGAVGSQSPDCSSCEAPGSSSTEEGGLSGSFIKVPQQDAKAGAASGKASSRSTASSYCTVA